VDFNHDGLLDLICGDRNGYINYFRRKPDHTLTTEPDLKANGLTIDAGYNSAPHVVDWNEDGLYDLVIGNDTSENLLLYINSGTPSSYLYTTYSAILVGGSPIKFSRGIPHVIDLNLDGKKDIVVGEDYGYVYYLKNVGTDVAPIFNSSVKLKSNGSPLSWPSGQTDLTVWIDDWNEDGVPDILLGNYVKNVYIYLGKGPHSLLVDEHIVPLNTPVTLNFDIKPGVSYAGAKHLLLCGISGTHPGFPVPGGKMMPMNFDLFTQLALTNINSPVFNNFYGKLNGVGEGAASFSTNGGTPISPLLYGTELIFCAVVKPAGSKTYFVTNVQMVYMQ